MTGRSVAPEVDKVALDVGVDQFDVWTLTGLRMFIKEKRGVAAAPDRPFRYPLMRWLLLNNSAVARIIF